MNQAHTLSSHTDFLFIYIHRNSQSETRLLQSPTHTTSSLSHIPSC